MADCEICGTELDQRGGRTRRTCSAACRQTAYRRRRGTELKVLRANAAAVRHDAAPSPPSPPSWLPNSPRACPITSSLRILGERGTLLVIREINYGVHRFQQIARFTGLSPDVLADRLRKLESAGVIERRQYSERPPRYEYHLTRDAGEELRPVLRALAEWGTKWASAGE
jgi:DNA-binding HxlR family transcriptional regulator